MMQSEHIRTVRLVTVLKARKELPPPTHAFISVSYPSLEACVAALTDIVLDAPEGHHDQHREDQVECLPASSLGFYFYLVQGTDLDFFASSADQTVFIR